MRVKTHGPWFTLMTAALTAAVIIIPAPATAARPTVEVATTAELHAAIASGADRISLAPGDYAIDTTLELVDVELVGQGTAGTPNDVTIRSGPGFDPAAHVPTPALATVAGTVTIDNIAFEGFFPFVGCDAAAPCSSAYVSSAPAENDGERNRITIRRSVFGAEIGSFALNGVILGNAAFSGSYTDLSTSIEFTDNFIIGGFAGLAIANYGETPGARIDAIVRDNELHDQLDVGLAVLGSTVGSGGTISGLSENNLITDSGFVGVAIGGGITSAFSLFFGAPFSTLDEFVGSEGGSFAKVDWTSHNDTVTGHVLGYQIFGGRRYSWAPGFGPSVGNDVRVRLISPHFDNILFRHVDLMGSSVNEAADPPANLLDGGVLGAGNTVTATIVGADFAGAPGKIWVQNHGVWEGTFDDPSIIPPMPLEPSYGNSAKLTGSQRSLGTTNPGVNNLPEAFFVGVR